MVMVEMQVHPPPVPTEVSDELKTRSVRSLNVSIFDVSSPDEMHELLSSFLLFPYTEIRFTPLARHPSAIV